MFADPGVQARSAGGGTIELARRLCSREHAWRIASRTRYLDAVARPEAREGAELLSGGRVAFELTPANRAGDDRRLTSASLDVAEDGAPCGAELALLPSTQWLRTPQTRSALHVVGV
jgi:hypothetical protein